MTSPDADSLASYGGAKADYLVAAVDATTDLSAASWNTMATTAAMNSRNATHAEASFVGVAGTPSAVTYEASWKGTTPTAPTGARSGVGLYTFTWPATVQDELLVSHTLNLQCAWGQVEGATAYHVQASATANVVSVFVFSMAGTASDAVGATIRVWAR